MIEQIKVRKTRTDRYQVILVMNGYHVPVRQVETKDEAEAIALEMRLALVEDGQMTINDTW